MAGWGIAADSEERASYLESENGSLVDSAIGRLLVFLGPSSQDSLCRDVGNRVTLSRRGRCAALEDLGGGAAVVFDDEGGSDDDEYGIDSVAVMKGGECEWRSRSADVRSVTDQAQMMPMLRQMFPSRNSYLMRSCSGELLVTLPPEMRGKTVKNARNPVPKPSQNQRCRP